MAAYDSERAEVSARRDCAVRAGIQDPHDSTACLEDFVDEIIRLRAEVARLTDAYSAACDRLDGRDRLERSERRLLGIIESAICMLAEGPDALESSRLAGEEAIKILRAARR